MMGGKRAPTSASTVTENGLPWPFFDGQAVRFYDRGVSKRRFLCFAPRIDEGIHVEL